MAHKKSKKQWAAIHAKKGGLTAYDVKAKKKVNIVNPTVFRMKNGMYAYRGKSSATGITVVRIIGKQKPMVQ